jgi:aminoglycoside/choline kinase family phosphotransferase
MIGSAETWVTWTEERFGVRLDQNHKAEAILKGGSDRSFHRLTVPGIGPVIVSCYGAEREENALYADIAAFLNELGAPVPKMLGHDPAKRVMWMEDLGAHDLFALRGAAWPERKEAYRRALEAVEPLHQRGLARLHQRGGPKLMPGFDAHLYAWERNYFFERFVHGLCRAELSAGLKTAVEEELLALADRLLALPQGLVHRDFQSQNIMLREGRAYLIDFQGMRTGTPFYDLGSLLYDPYVRLLPEERAELVEIAWQLEGGGMGQSDFRAATHAAAVQRLLQALGAYGFLGIIKGKREFLHHVKPGLLHVREAMQAAGGFEALEQVLALGEPSALARVEEETGRS